jgi:hypothetical protein
MTQHVKQRYSDKRFTPRSFCPSNTRSTEESRLTRLPASVHLCRQMPYSSRLPRYIRKDSSLSNNLSKSMP